jgi:hypothetical protein
MIQLFAIFIAISALSIVGRARARPPLAETTAHAARQNYGYKPCAEVKAQQQAQREANPKGEST